MMISKNIKGLREVFSEGLSLFSLPFLVLPFFLFYEKTNIYSQEEKKIVYKWEIDHYEPQPGKILGIWNYVRTKSELKMLKEKYGYSGVFIMSGEQSLYDIATKELGFDKDKLLVSISYPSGTDYYEKWIKDMPAENYYIDESVNHGCLGNGNRRLYDPDEFKAIKKYIQMLRPGSKLITSGYKRCAHLEELGKIADLMMYSSYSNWVYHPELPCLSNMPWGPKLESSYIEAGYDQRQSWTDMKNIFGKRFSSTWIKTIEVSEFFDLFAHAKKLGLDQIWVYNYMEEDKNGNPVSCYRSDQYEAISQAAYKNGFLKQYLKEMKAVYKRHKGDWIIESESPTGKIKENMIP
ncbi:MAG: hypothetical protein Q8940_14870 [Bacteroidota bacterium]|nr:hypothetical protein [Bacteroidota bacterium]